jgi:hypothetical protein
VLTDFYPVLNVGVEFAFSNVVKPIASVVSVFLQPTKVARANSTPIIDKFFITNIFKMVFKV